MNDTTARTCPIPVDGDGIPTPEGFARAYLELPALPDAFRTPQIAEKMTVIARALLINNRKFNLTAIRQPEEVLSKHILDSLLAAREIAQLCEQGLIPAAPRLLDVGSGAGFPSLPVAAALPECRVIAMDATAKKCRHISETASAAGITTLSAVSGRAEDLAFRDGYRAAFDVVTARAVAALPVLAELCVPFLRTGGIFLSMKGQSGPREAREAARALSLLGAEEAGCITYTVPGDDAPRYLLLFRKVRPTPPAYPRPYAQILKRPL